MATLKVNKAALLRSVTLDEYRKAGGEEMSSENQRIRGKLVEREFGSCISALVHHFATNSDALTGSGYDYDDILNLCSQDDWENTVREDDGFVRSGPGEIVCRVDGQEEEFDNWRDAAQALSLDDPQRNEAYEHWVVSDWFAAKLEEHGEIVTHDFFNLTVWGRCCTGQSIMMDSVIGAIAAEMQILDGQQNAWTA